MIGFPFSKINIGLRIVGKRPDGYHNIETIFYPVNFCDALEFIVPQPEIDRDILTISGIDPGIDPGKNLVMRTAEKMHKKYAFPNLKIHLHKAIPSGAGLGGGSSDAVCLMKAVNRSFLLKMTVKEMKDLSLELGSDCPFFVEHMPAIAEGRGEILKPVKQFLEGFYFILLNPKLSISTKVAYENCIPRATEGNFTEMILQPVEEWKNLITNDFEKYAFSIHPLIGEIKNEVYNSGALFSLMSGSGSSVFGIFRKKPLLPVELKQYVIYEGIL